jgi:glycosyltransferase involved in cell wall biosynthesis
MKTLIAATWSMPPNTLSGIQAGLHPRLDYLDLAKRLSADWLDYDSAAGLPALRRLEDVLRLDLRLALEVTRRVRHEKYDVVLSLSERVGILLAPALGRRVRQAVILHHPLSRLKLRMLRLTGLHRAWRLMLCLSRAEAEEFKRALGLTDNEVQVLTTPVDVAFYRPDFAPAEPVEADAEAPHLLSFGLSYRDYPTLIAAMRQLPEIRCHIRAGSSWVYGRSGYEQEALPANVTSHPFVHPSMLRGIVRRSRFVVLSLQPGTQWAAGCTSVQIAQAMGKAVIATRLPGLEDYVAHGETGLLVPAKDPAALAAAIDRLWRDLAEAEQMGARGRRRMEAEFSLDQWLDRWASLAQALWGTLCASVLTSAISHMAW